MHSPVTFGNLVSINVVVVVVVFCCLRFDTVGKACLGPLGLGSWEAAKLPMHENLLSSAPCLSLERAVACVEIAMVIHSQSIGHPTR